MTSSDGEHWVSRLLPEGATPEAVAFGNAQFVAVGAGGLVSTSPDGVNWTRQVSGVIGSIVAVVYDAGQFQAMATAPYHEGLEFLGSRDGVTWITELTRPTSDLRGLGIGDGQLIAVGQGGIVLSSPVPSREELRCGRSYSDVSESYWACTAIERLAALHVVSGYPDGAFGPERTVNRAEFVKMLGLTMGRIPTPQESVAFADVSNHWVGTQGYLQAIGPLRLINGFEDGTFHPDEPITRAQLAKIAVRALGFGSEGPAPYADVAPSDWYAQWVTGAYLDRLIGPHASIPMWTGSVFSSERPVTRAEAAAVLAGLAQAKL